MTSANGILPKYSILFFCVIIFFSNCKKEKTGCWDVYTSNGSLTQTLCDKSEDEIRNVYGKYYDVADAAKYCWKATYPTYFVYAEKLSEKMAGIFFGDAVRLEKIICGYCQTWECYTKKIYKPTNEFFNSVPYYQSLCGDTCLTLYPGREIKIRETADSIVSTIFNVKL